MQMPHAKRFAWASFSSRFYFFHKSDFLYSFFPLLIFRGGLSWWDSQFLCRVGRWTWAGNTFKVADVVILASNLAEIGHASATAISHNSPGGDAGGGDPRPCVVCTSKDGEVRVLRLGGDGCEELHRAPSAASVGMEGTGMLTVPSPSRHQFLLVTRWAVLDPLTRVFFNTTVRTAR